MGYEGFIFTQITKYISYYDFDRCVDRYNGNWRIRQFSCRDQFLAMMFGQLCNRKSLRDLIISLNAHTEKHYKLGFRANIQLSTLARANENRDYRIYEDLSKIIISKARQLYLNDADFPFTINGNLYLIDSSTIDLCLTMFKWATFRTTKSAIKMHTQIDGRGILPALTVITNASVHDTVFLDSLIYEIGAYYVLDRGYLDYLRLHRIHEEKAFFIVRAKSNMAFKRLYSRPVDKSTGLRADQVIRFTSHYSRKRYSDMLRRIKYYDKETDVHYIFLTNDMNTDALVIAQMYKYRWRIELFFKWIKQHLKIISFWGRSANAVKVQIYIAICTYGIILIMRKDLKIEMDAYQMLQILSISLFEQTPIQSLFSKDHLQLSDVDISEQLTLLHP